MRNYLGFIRTTEAAYCVIMISAAILWGSVCASGL